MIEITKVFNQLYQNNIFTNLIENMKGNTFPPLFELVRLLLIRFVSLLYQPCYY